MRHCPDDFDLVERLRWRAEHGHAFGCWAVHGNRFKTFACKGV